MSTSSQISLKLRSTNVLNAREVHRLHKWWESVAPTMDGKTADEIAEIATKELEFRVTRANIYTAYDVTDLRPKRPVRSRAIKGGARVQFDRSRHIAIELLDIQRQLGLPESPVLKAIRDYERGEKMEDIRRRWYAARNLDY